MSKNDYLDKDLEFLEEELLKCNIKDIPIPNDDIEDLEEEVLEVMKSGCNRQIAEYVIIKYKELKDEENGKPKLILFKENYLKSREEYFKEIKGKITDNKIVIEEVKKKYEKIYNKERDKEGNFEQFLNNKLKDYEDEIKKFSEEKSNEDIEIKSDEYVISIKCNLFKDLYIGDRKNKDGKTKKFFEDREKYIQKREAVIEACLRKVKKIVNDEEEYNKFYNEYMKKK
jgi:hypothetical protein